MPQRERWYRKSSILRSSQRREPQLTLAVEPNTSEIRVRSGLARTRHARAGALAPFIEPPCAHQNPHRHRTEHTRSRTEHTVCVLEEASSLDQKNAQNTVRDRPPHQPQAQHFALLGCGDCACGLPSIDASDRAEVTVGVCGPRRANDSLLDSRRGCNLHRECLLVRLAFRCACGTTSDLNWRPRTTPRALWPRALSADAATVRALCSRALGC